MSYELSELKLDMSHGLIAFHNQRCGIDFNEKAVYDLNNGIFHPSWRAHRDGWKLIKINNKLQKLIYKLFFK